MFYIYELTDPRNEKVFYVGKGKKSRVDVHEREARKGVKSAKCDLIREIHEAGLTVSKRRVASFADEQEAYDAEAELILFYGLENLTNVIPGGFGGASGHSIYDDRSLLSKAADIMGRMDAFNVQGVKINGQFMDLRPFYEDLRDRITTIIERHGLDWANEIAKRHRVQFV